MAGTIIAKYLRPLVFRREAAQQRLDALRRRDGDNCRRCRRAMRFDLPRGHDQAPKLEPILHKSNGGAAALDNFCLCHTRCNAEAADNTAEVQGRVRMKQEAALFSRPKRRANARRA